MANLDMRNMPDHYPRRGDQVEAWIKDRRDEHKSRSDWGDTVAEALDNLLDEYRLAADTGQSLENIVNGEPEDTSETRPPKTGKKKKQGWMQHSPGEGSDF